MRTSPHPRHEPHTILLATFNGARFLAEQLCSLSEQTDAHWRMIVSDDGSTDETRRIVETFAEHVPQEVTLIDGPKRGFAANFAHLIASAPTDHGVVLFCDQDDVWLPTHIERAVSALAGDEPTLYGARTTVTDQNLNPLGHSRLPRLPLWFSNALVQSFAGGNTMALNRAGFDLLRRATSQAPDFASHDWWMYQIVSGCGGRIIYDPVPTTLYRQHSDNLVGHNRGFTASVRRLGAFVRGDFRAQTDANLRALQANRGMLTPSARRQLDRFCAIRETNPIARTTHFATGPIRRQGVMGRVTLCLGGLAGLV
ncbi:glycosyltransferase family 2 protein [Rhodovulum sp. FJ3]|uniref:glycosyltransferase family 2 protein n=1 Tax=Rhodovulum sp. FJ3 TaxID=3079053 RepID=UPI00293DD773|nr:glycosyltransferase family 2 protein [Rhodovulum sp. FJ3]MDV4169939.1 glycosyltransferase family 2 protein [Rhodovulum sp. FJ3]